MCTLNSFNSKSYRQLINSETVIMKEKVNNLENYANNENLLKFVL